LGRSDDAGSGRITDPVVAATVNGRPIYIEDVRRRAVDMGRLQEGEDLDSNSDAFYLTLEELIQFRLFSMEAEQRGLDRDADVRRQLEAAREQVLASAIYDQIDAHANDPAAIEKLYRDNNARLDQGQEIHLRHIQFDTMEAAQAAKRRLDNGERFETLAYQLSRDTDTGADGGDLGFRAASDLTANVRQAVLSVPVGTVVGPIQIADTWHLLRVDDIRQRGAPSLEELRPRIITWLRFKEISELEQRLERNARIVRLRQQDNSSPGGGDVTEPATSPTPVVPQTRPGQAPDVERPGQAPPAFPFPMGPGGVYGTATSTTPAVSTATTAAPASTAPLSTAPSSAPTHSAGAPTTHSASTATTHSASTATTHGASTATTHSVSTAITHSASTATTHSPDAATNHSASTATTHGQSTSTSHSVTTATTHSPSTTTTHAAPGHTTTIPSDGPVSTTP
jgi:peptidyl-prolyl cis-trans isomerase C